MMPGSVFGRACRSLLNSVSQLIAPLERWTEKEQTQAEVRVFILDHLFETLPTPPFTTDEKQGIAQRVYQHIWQQSASGYTDNQQGQEGITSGFPALELPRPVLTSF